jgi:16S rRNA (guanine527-N7)-methyltransferase
MAIAAELQAGIIQLGLDVDILQQQKLLQYVQLLHKWNKVYNLTAIRDLSQMVSNHLLDSMAIAPYLWGKNWLDVGCGAGLPGIVLAVLHPDWQFTLLDSNSKKTGFVKQAVIELGLENVNVHCARVESFETNMLFDGIVSRAFTELGDFLMVSDHLLAASGRWAAMKGVAEKELQNVSTAYQIERLIHLQVPGVDAARSLVVVSRNGAKQYD